MTKIVGCSFGYSGVYSYFAPTTAKVGDFGIVFVKGTPKLVSIVRTNLTPEAEAKATTKIAMLVPSEDIKAIKQYLNDGIDYSATIGIAAYEEEDS